MPSDPRSPNDAVVDSRGRRIPREVAEELNTARLRIRPAVVAERMWRYLFTDEDHQRLGGGLRGCWSRLGTVRMWIEARGVSVERAVIDIASGLELLSAEKAKWLLRELGLEDAEPAETSDRPIWLPDRGEVRLCDRVIRRVRVMREPSNIQQILDAFQAAGWPPRIDNPLAYGQERLHQSLRSLNGDLEMVRFRAREGGEAITWERR